MVLLPLYYVLEVSQRASFPAVLDACSANGNKTPGAPSSSLRILERQGGSFSETSGIRQNPPCLSTKRRDEDGAPWHYKTRSVSPFARRRYQHTIAANEKIKMIVEMALISGVMPRRRRPHISRGSVLSRPMRKKLTAISSIESVKMSSAAP